MIGFSLGAHTAGLIAQYLQSGKLKRITGLDPAKPMFVLLKAAKRLSEKDAVFVDVVHTDVLQRGILQPLGHVDFYVNGGIEQPGCQYQTETSAYTFPGPYICCDDAHIFCVMFAFFFMYI